MAAGCQAPSRFYDSQAHNATIRTGHMDYDLDIKQA